MSKDEYGISGRDGISRRGFLGGLGGAAALGGLAAAGEAKAAAAPVKTTLPAGRALRVQPVFTYALPGRAEKTSWRSYGDIQTREHVDAEAGRIEAELKVLAARAEFPIEFLPIVLADDDAKVTEAAARDCDTFLIYAANGAIHWYAALAAAKPQSIMFIRHKSGPYYLWHEIAHWRFLRRNGDTFEEPNMDVDDIVVDDYGEVLWRLRALYGLANARGTKVLAIGGLHAYSQPAQELGPPHGKDVWGYDYVIVSEEDYGKRLAAARSDAKTMEEVEAEAAALLAEPGVTLETERRFVVNSFLALRVCEAYLRESGATNFGFGRCMGRPVIEMLDTPPCLVLSLANDKGWTAYCHTDLSHTFPGVLLRWITGKPTFLCNTHFPHHGIFTVAHCAAPRKMDGLRNEPARIMTHFESDYGAATKVAYTKGQVVSIVMPNLRCSKWMGIRGTIVATPSLEACRSQMDIAIDGDFREVLTDMQGFHTQIVYGDYLREVGYALKTLRRIEWQDTSAKA
ncbi:MAG: sugar isomerase [Planctomycetes bacterium]|nr:sugar isomerase [Planctomycetota bacterium]